MSIISILGFDSFQKSLLRQAVNKFSFSCFAAPAILSAQLLLVLDKRVPSDDLVFVLKEQKMLIESFSFSMWKWVILIR